MSKTKIIYSLKIHIQLQIKGFHPIYSMPNPHNEKYLCWIYNRDDNFDKVFDEIVTRLEAENG